VKLDKSTTETLEMLREAFGEHSLSQTAVFEWHSRFKTGRVSVEDDERSGRPSTSKMTENVVKIRELIHEGCYQTIHELTDNIGISYGRKDRNLPQPQLAPSRQCIHLHIPENHRVCD
jgi:hypothetical protein